MGDFKNIEFNMVKIIRIINKYDKVSIERKLCFKTIQFLSALLISFESSIQLHKPIIESNVYINYLFELQRRQKY